MKRFRLLPVIAAVFITLPLGAQEEISAPGETLFTPFVSRIEAEIKNNLLRLSWMDSPDVKGPLYIYSSGAPFAENAEISALGRPVEVPYGSESYIYEIDSPGTYYYFVVASDQAGTRYNLPILFSNAISIVIEDSGGGLALGAEDPSERAEIPTGPSGSLPVTGLEAVNDGERVIITFKARDMSRRFILYRSAKPLREVSDLAEAIIVQPDAASPHTDYPVPGVPYYYAVIPEEELTRGTAGIYPGQNASSGPVEVPAGRQGAAGSSTRNFPLPPVSLNAAVPGLYAEPMPQSETLSAEAAGLLEDLGRPPKSLPLMAPRVIAGDLDEEAGGGEEYGLRSIIRDSFEKKDWERCRGELQRFLALPRSGNTEARARFYLGQCYYFLNLQRESLFEFLEANDSYPSESAEWIRAVLAILSN
jgi:hypothetical protein